HDERVIYFEIQSPEEEKAAAIDTLVSGLDQMNEESKVISVETAGKKLNHFARKWTSTEETTDPLLQAIQNFQRKIVPHFKMVEDLNKQIKHLTESQTDLNSRVLQVARLEKELSTMHKERKEQEQQRDKAIDLARQASNETVDLRQNLANLKMRISEIEESNTRYKDQLSRHMYAGQQLKAKNKILEQENESLKNLVELTRRAADKNETSQNVEVDLSLSKNGTVAMSSQPESSIVPSLPHTTQRDFEGMPRPGFQSDWQLPNTAKKRKTSAQNQTQGILGLSVNRKGRPVGAVQLGPKRTSRAPLR
ncbi:hypothetical protein H0H81_002894, partial [Sphagnurus paluster]